MQQMKLIKQFKTSFEIKASQTKELLCLINNKTVVYNLKNLEEQAVLNKPTYPSKIGFSGDGKYLVSKSTNGTICVYDTNTLGMINSFQSTKSFKIVEGGFAVTQDNKTILDIIEKQEGNQIVSLNIENGEKTILTEFKNYIINFNYSSQKEKLHLFTLNNVNEDTGYREYNIGIIEEPISKQAIRVLENPLNLNWDAAVLYSQTNTFVVINDQEIILVNSEFNTVLLKKVLHTENGCLEDIGYFEHVHISNDKALLIVTYSNIIFVLRVDNLEIIAAEKVMNACFAEFSNDDRYVFVGTWENGYLLENNL